MKQRYDVVVVGAGHAGCEAASVAARSGARTALVTMRADTIGVMSCNPAIGGIGKGHIVREIDVFDGVIARAADAAAIHYRMLNRSKGIAVHGPRVQADRAAFQRAVCDLIGGTPNLTVIVGEAKRLLADGRAITGIELSDGRTIIAPSVILATGTFLEGRLFYGHEREAGGRWCERASGPLGEQLRALGLPLGRLKTGTPPRLDGRTIDWSRLEIQRSDPDSWTMSALGARVRPQMFCALARTNRQTHGIIAAALDASPLATGAITGRGPRYCPSIEDKVTRFADRDSHQLFLEPEGSGTELVYPNGISTSLPIGVQRAMLRTILGLERVSIAAPGYAVEYTHVDPRILDHRLAARDWPGLFLAGQINGTTGYEEAAGQGLIAGLNAAAAALGRSPVLLSRHSSYIGVMIDDLVLQGVTEPYRMLTARAENRLYLRADNAESRLAPIAHAAGCLTAEKISSLQANAAARDRVRAALEASAGQASRGEPEAGLADINERADILEEVTADARYAPYIERQHREYESAIATARPIAHGFDYSSLRGLSIEMRERLEAARPGTTDEASRIPGITPAAVTALWLAQAATG